MTEFYRPGPSGSRQVLVYLHGHGSAPDLVHPFFRQHHDDGWVRLCPRGPLPTDGGWSWFDSSPRGVDRAGLDASVARVRTLVEATTGDLGATWSDVVVAGFSQGASLALGVAAALGADGVTIGGLLVQAGFAPEVFGDEVDLGTVRARSVLVQHGESDEVVPSFMAGDLGASIGASSGAVDGIEVQLLPGGHTLSPAMLDAARRWLAGEPDEA